MLTFIFLIILCFILYFVIRKLVRQKLIIEQLRDELKEMKK